MTAWDTVNDAREFYRAMSSLRTVVEGSKRAWFDLGPGLSDCIVEYQDSDRVMIASWVGIDRREAESILEELVFEEIDED